MSFAGPSECSDASSKEVTVSEEDDEFTVESGSASEDHPSDSEGMWMTILELYGMQHC